MLKHVLLAIVGAKLFIGSMATHSIKTFKYVYQCQMYCCTNYGPTIYSSIDLKGDITHLSVCQKLAFFSKFLSLALQFAIVAVRKSTSELLHYL